MPLCPAEPSIILLLSRRAGPGQSFISLVTVWALTLAFVAGVERDALPETGNGLALQTARACALELPVDPALSAAAARHGAALLAGRLDAPEASVRAVGLGDSAVLPVASLGPDRRKLVEAAAGRCPPAAFGATHVGAGWARGEGRWAATILYSRRVIDWSAARWRKGFEVAGRSSGPTSSGRLAWLQGCSSELICDRAQERAWRGQLQLRLSSADVVELLADTETGPIVVGLWVRPGLEPSTPEATEAESAWTALRRVRGLPAGQENPTLTRAAQAHADYICRRGRAEHLDDQGRRPRARAREAGWSGPVAENVAVARDLSRAFGNLLLSPTHHATLVDPRVRSFGFGQAEADGQLCLVQMFGHR